MPCPCCVHAFSCISRNLESRRTRRCRASTGHMHGTCTHYSLTHLHTDPLTHRLHELTQTPLHKQPTNLHTTADPRHTPCGAHRDRNVSDISRRWRRRARHPFSMPSRASSSLCSSHHSRATRIASSRSTLSLPGAYAPPTGLCQVSRSPLSITCLDGHLSHALMSWPDESFDDR